MATIAGVFSNMLNILESLAPKGISAVNFWGVLVISFALLYLLLDKTNVFKDNKGITFIVSLVMAYFVSASAVATIVISKLFPNLGMAIMALLGVLIVTALVAPKLLPGSEGGFGKATIFFVIAVVLILTYYAVVPELTAAGYTIGVGGTSLSEEDIAVLAIIGGIILVVSMFFKGKDGETPLEKLLKRR